MKKDRLLPYKNTVDQLRKESMHWEFEEFLSQVEESSTKAESTRKSSKNKIIALSFTVAAAAMALLVSTLVLNESAPVTPQLAKSQEEGSIPMQKEVLYSDLPSDSVKVRNSSAVSIEPEVLMEKILPKRGRIKRQMPPTLVQRETTKPKSDVVATVNADLAKGEVSTQALVTINGQEVKNQQEALELTHYSLRVLSENVNRTVSSTSIINEFGN